MKKRGREVGVDGDCGVCERVRVSGCAVAAAESKKETDEEKYR